MIPLGLSSADLADLALTLRTPHRLRVGVALLDLGHNRLADLSGYHKDGQVTLDATSGAEADRSAQVVLGDPEYRLGIDARDPADIRTGPHRMLQITYSVQACIPGAQWYKVPVFTGPIIRPQRKGSDITVECLGKDYLCRHALHGTKTWPKGTRKTDIIRDILVTVCGEDAARVEVATHTARTTGATTLLSDGDEGDPWALVQLLADQVGWSARYDGRGNFRCGPVVQRAVYSFRHGEDGNLIDYPEMGDDAFELVNRWRVVGRSSGKTEPTGVALAPTGSRLNPYTLGRNGVGMAWTKDVRDDTITTTTQAKAKAAKLRDAESGVTYVDAAITVYPAPHIELDDLVDLSTPDFGRQLAYSRATIPLNSDPKQSVGITARMTK